MQQKLGHRNDTCMTPLELGATWFWIGKITYLAIDIKLYKHYIMSVMGPYKGCKENMVDLIYFELELLNKKLKI